MSKLGALWRLRRSLAPHRAGVGLARRHMEALLHERWRVGPSSEGGDEAYVGRNFFSLLLVSVYEALDLSSERLAFFAAVNHVVRSIVTAADNLIDDEDKPILALRLPAAAPRFRNCLGLIAWSLVLRRVLDAGAAEGLLGAARAETVAAELLDALVSVGSIEAEEEAGVGEVLSPDAVVSHVHDRKGGQLLGLAFVVPRLALVGHEAAERLEAMARGMHDVGLALQHVDDVTDLAVDLAEGRHNLLRSEIVHGGTEAERRFLAALAGAEDGEAVHRRCAPSVGRVVRRALETARRGFARMEDVGYPLTADEAMSLVRALFRVRGEGKLLRLAEGGEER